MVPRSRSETETWLRALVCAVLFLPPAAHADDPLGRLFTTPQQRQKLEELRRAELESPEPVSGPGVVVAETPDTPGRDLPLDPIKVKGLVTRESGRSMAFINESNTYEGDLASEYIRVRSSDIRGGEIRIVTPYREDAVALKVGQTLEPSTGRIIDLTDEEFRAEESAVPGPVAAPDAPPAVSAPPGE